MSTSPTPGWTSLGKDPSSMSLIQIPLWFISHSVFLHDHNLQPCNEFMLRLSFLLSPRQSSKVCLKNEMYLAVNTKETNIHTTYRIVSKIFNQEDYFLLFFLHAES